MKKTLLCISCICALAILPASAASYADAVSDTDVGPWGDISSVDVNNDATTLTFKINTAGDPDLVANNWHHYYIGISTGVSGPAGGNLNTTGYGRNIQMSVDGMDFALLSYPAFNGYDRFETTAAPTMTFDGVGTTSWDASGVTITALLSDLGLSLGGNLKFDVWTSTAGTDTVLDALSDGTFRTWNSDPFDTGANALSYTVVPEPTSGMLLGMAAMMILARRGIRRNRWF
jgi:hypothetical protein